MRLKLKEIADIKSSAKACLGDDAKVFLFGSRVDDSKKGGDIDLLILTNEKKEFKDISRMRINLYKAMGEQKIDIVNFAITDKNPFKELALEHSIEL